MVRQPVRVLDNGKHQIGRRANTRHGTKWMEEADITLYAEQCLVGDLSHVKSMDIVLPILSSHKASIIYLFFFLEVNIWKGWSHKLWGWLI